jgi:hypothetical protein
MLGFVQVRVFALECSSWGVQVGVFKLGCSSWGVEVCAFKLGVQVGAFCEFLVSIVRWSKPPHHVKVNPLGEVLSMM